MAICQWQSFKAAECWICQISLMVTLWCQAIWCYLMLSDAADVICYLSLYLSCASSLPCTQSSAVPGVSRRLSPCDSDVFRAVACGHRMPSAASAPSASRSKYKASDFAFSSVDTWPARRLRKTSPCLSKVTKKHHKTISSQALRKSYEVFTCFPLFPQTPWQSQQDPIKKDSVWQFHLIQTFKVSFKSFKHI
jgi:hypothetical protein